MRPGMASELLRELAPLLAEEGIDVDNIDVPGLDTLRQAMNRAIERHSLIRPLRTGFRGIRRVRGSAAVGRGAGAGSGTRWPVP
jgi:hypothetical protein